MDLLINFVKISTYLYYQNLLKLRMHPQHFTSVLTGQPRHRCQRWKRTGSSRQPWRQQPSSQVLPGAIWPWGLWRFVCSIVFKTWDMFFKGSRTSWKNGRHRHGRTVNFVLCTQNTERYRPRKSLLQDRSWQIKSKPDRTLLGKLEQWRWAYRAYLSEL